VRDKQEINMCKDDMNKDCCCCIQGPQGVPGLQGSQGIQGVPGSQGLTGSQGVQGVQGLQGPAGTGGGGGRGGCERFANVFCTFADNITPYNTAGDAVVFDSANAVSSAADFNIALAATTGDVQVLKHGIYHISWELQGLIAPPVPSPVPSWSFGLWMSPGLPAPANYVLIPGSIDSGFTQSPNDSADHSNGEVIVEVMAGSLIRLRNTSSAGVILSPTIVGSVFPVTTASLNIFCLKELA
jgi:hypothetical protein